MTREQIANDPEAALWAVMEEWSEARREARRATFRRDPVAEKYRTERKAETEGQMAYMLHWLRA